MYNHTVLDDTRNLMEVVNQILASFCHNTEGINKKTPFLKFYVCRKCDLYSTFKGGYNLLIFDSRITQPVTMGCIFINVISAFIAAG